MLTISTKPCEITGLEEYNTAGSFAWANVFGNTIDEVLVRSATSSQYYYAHNHLYSPVAVMDFTAGTVLERYDYDAYGATHIMDASFNSRTASAVGNPYSFTGRELDTLDGGNLKTMHYRHRSYDPFMGRFGQEDFFGINPDQQMFSYFPYIQYYDGLNLYHYVSSRPISFIDSIGSLKRPSDAIQTSADQEESPIMELLEQQQPISAFKTSKGSNCTQWRNAPKPSDDCDTHVLMALCAQCCAEIFTSKVPAGSSPRQWIGWFAWYRACKASCIATDGQSGPGKRGPGGKEPEEPRKPE